MSLALYPEEPDRKSEGHLDWYRGALKGVDTHFEMSDGSNVYYKWAPRKRYLWNIAHSYGREYATAWNEVFDTCKNDPYSSFRPFDIDAVYGPKDGPGVKM